ncbi:MAG: LysR family transcriptional regulator [Rhizobiaceae bacterium]|nr:LysR family transcriptional regulator [Hyphomicrobiales bacterium]NRB31269.1 LysR family transcriptional regulator [Rhizobiaceae bacterium]
MDRLSGFDWTQIRFFVSVAETGSLSACARATGASQPTVGRAIASLEQSLGVSLFKRHARGFELTPQGADLLPHARAMANAAADLSLAAEGRSQALEGTVRITASRIVATYVLPTILAQLQLSEPRIDIELVATDTVENLLFREADIALRMMRPSQQDLISKRVGDLPMGAYASRDYLARNPAPEKIEDLFDHVMIGYDRSSLIIDGARSLGLQVHRDFFAYRTDDQIAYWQLVRAGLGIGFTARPVARQDDKVVRILPQMEIPPLPIWLTSHGALKTSRRVRYVFDFLAAALKADLKSA